MKNNCWRIRIFSNCKSISYKCLITPRLEWPITVPTP